ncbi:hypothetical protein D3C76_1652260 [compost metagenome]
MAGQPAHHNQGQHGGSAGAQPVLVGDAEEADELVENTCRQRIINPQPHHGQGHTRGYGGQVVDALEHILHLLAQGQDHDGDDEGEKQIDGNSQ